MLTDPVSLIVPAEIVVFPVYVLVADKVKVPAPVLVTLPVEIAIGSLMVQFQLNLWLSYRLQ